MKAPVNVGDVVAGKYEIKRVLASGGMGVVVAARHLKLERLVALKFVHAELLATQHRALIVERFLREGKAAVRLRGENVARVLDVDALEDGTPYIVMELLEGTDLAHFLAASGPLSLRDAVDYVLQACVAMAEAHKSGIVHRDLKPDNLFLTRRPDGSPLVKVLDFGVSRLHPTPGETIDDSKRTQVAVTMGSPAYMAPEQARSARDADARADIWSLGVILYELTSGAVPFAAEGGSTAVLALVIYEQPQSLAKLAPHLPQAFIRVVERCLQKSPDQRYQNVGELAAALEPFASLTGRTAAASIHSMLGSAPGVHGAVMAAASGDSLDLDVAAALANIHEDALAPLDQRAGATGLRAIDISGNQPIANRARKPPTPPADFGHGATLPLAPAAEPVAAPAAVEAVPAVSAAPVAPLTVGEAPLELDMAAAMQPKQAGVSNPVGANLGGIVEHDFGSVPKSAPPLLAAKPPIPRPQPQGRTMATSERIPWLDGRRMAELAVALVMTAFTALIVLSKSQRVVIDGANDALHRLGHAVFARGWAGEIMHLLGGTIMQLAVPLILYLVLLRFGQRMLAGACIWWLGEGMVHTSRDIADAIPMLRTPLAGDGIHAWGALLRHWDKLAEASDLARYVYWAGVSIMVSALFWAIQQALKRQR